MAEMTSTSVLGNLSVTGKINGFGGISVFKLEIPTSSGATTLGVGSAGQVLKSNGSTIYWDNCNSANSFYAANGVARFLHNGGNTGGWNEGTLYVGGGHFKNVVLSTYETIQLDNDDITLLEASSDYVKLKNASSDTYLEFNESKVNLKGNGNNIISGGSALQTKVGHTTAPTEIYGYHVQIDNLKKVKAPTASNGDTYDYGSQNQVLMADGVGGVYWGANSTAGNRGANVIVSAAAAGQINSEKFSVTSSGGVKVTMQYDSSLKALKFVF